MVEYGFWESLKLVNELIWWNKSKIAPWAKHFPVAVEEILLQAALLITFMLLVSRWACGGPITAVYGGRPDNDEEQKTKDTTQKKNLCRYNEHALSFAPSVLRALRKSRSEVIFFLPRWRTGSDNARYGKARKYVAVHLASGEATHDVLPHPQYNLHSIGIETAIKRMARNFWRSVGHSVFVP